MRRLILKKAGLIIALAISAGLYLFLAPTCADDLHQSGQNTSPRYVKDEIIVKFAKDVTTDIPRSLEVLNERYNVTKIAPLFKNFKENQKKWEALKQKNRSLLNIKERHLTKRSKRAPNGEETPDLSSIFLLKLKLSEGQLAEDAIADYNCDPNVIYAEPNFTVSIYRTPNDPLFDSQWPLNNYGQIYPETGSYVSPPGKSDADIDAPEAWDICIGNTDVVVAVLDTGVDYAHRDLDGNMWLNEAELNGTEGVDDDGNGYEDDIYGYNFAYDRSDPMDDNGHGTHCAGTIAAEGDNHCDITGVCWDARIMALKFLNSLGGGDIYNAADAIYYAVENGADVISNSWGLTYDTETLREAIEYAHSCGVVIIAAAGNDDTDDYHYPASYSDVIAVSATDSQDEKASFSSYGDWIDVAAPGVDILSLRSHNAHNGTAHDEYTSIMSGTSMACPHVAGLAALILSLNPDLTNDEVRQIIRDSADDLPGQPGFDPYFGYGRINAYNATLEIPNTNGRIFFNDPQYTAPSTPVITVMDADLIGSGTVRVKVSSSTETKPEEIELVEAVPGKGIFQGTISLSSTGRQRLNNGKLIVRHNDMITAIYEETSPVGTKADTASIDINGPIISSLEVFVEVALEEEGVVTITWMTDEPSTSTVYYGLTSEPDQSIANFDYVMEHIIVITGLEAGIPYYFKVESQDATGNVTIDDNGGSMHEIPTALPVIQVEPASITTDPIFEKSHIITENITISNIAGESCSGLIFEIPEPAQGWLSVSPKKGKVPVGGSMDVQVSIKATYLAAGTHEGEILINNNTVVQNPVIIPVALDLIPAPAVGYQEYRIVDNGLGRSYNVNDDRHFNSGERVEIQIELNNAGSLPAEGMAARLSLSEADPDITIIDGEISCGDIQPGAYITCSDTFVVEASQDIEDKHLVGFVLETEDGSGNLWEGEFQVPVLPPLPGASSGNLRIDRKGGFTHINPWSFDPQIACDSKGNVYIAWNDSRYDYYDLSYDRIFFNRSHDFGFTWQDYDVALSRRFNTFYSINADFPQICADENGNIHVIFWALWNASYNYSKDYGVTWMDTQSDLNIYEHIPNQPPLGPVSPYSQPQISCDDKGNVYGVWGSYADNKIALNHSSDYGDSWLDYNPRFGEMAGEGYDNIGRSHSKVVAKDSGHVYIVWHDRRNGSADIYLNYSSHAGGGWKQEDIRLDRAPDGIDSTHPKICADDKGHVYVVWEDSRNGEKDIYFNYSSDYGVTWQTSDIRLDREAIGTYSGDPQICADNKGNVYVVWEDSRNGEKDIYFNYSSDYGVTWQVSDIRIDSAAEGTSYSGEPQICCGLYEDVYVAWEDSRDGRSDIYLNYSLDGGENWKTVDMRIDDDLPGAASSYQPQITTDGRGIIYLVWTDMRRGDYGERDIYFNSLFIKEESVAPVADFIGEPRSGDAPHTVTFFGGPSPGKITDYYWQFGDGETSTERYYTMHTYNNPGEYTVTLTVTGPGGSDVEIKTNYITVTSPPLPPVADFIGEPRSGDAPHTVTFFGGPSPGKITDYYWQFGDGETSTERYYTVHTYNNPGRYTVALTVTGPGGSDIEVKRRYIQVAKPR